MSCCLTPNIYAHQDESSDLFNLDQTVNVFQLAIESLEGPQDKMDSSFTPRVKVGGEAIILDSAFWQLVRRWIYIYQKEVQRDCSDCVEFTEDDLLAEAKDLARRGFFGTKVVDPISNATEHIALETADIGARLGHVALVAKVSSEVAETVLSKTVGGGGVHVLCSIIDAVILFGTRHLQIAARVPTWASKMNAGTLTVPLRYWLVSRAIKRAQKRVSFDLGPIEVNQTELQQLDLEGPSGTQIKWFNQQSQGRRAQWISLLERKLNPLYKERERLKEEIMDSSPSPWHQRRLNVVESQILKIATLKRKGFLGSRYKRFFFLKARRGKTHLKGQAPIEGALQKDFLWIASVQQNILHRGLISNDQNEIKKDFIAAQRLSTESIDPILLGLAEESAFDEGLMKALLADVESIFDVTQSKKIRYLRILLIEGALTQIGYKFLNWKVESVPTGEGGWLSRTARAARFRWSAGQFVKHVYEYTDFLRIAAASNSESFQIKHKYEAMESLIRIFDHLKKQDEIFNQYSNITEMLRPLKESNGKLSTFKPWLEKKTSYSWIPFKKSYPQCDEMWGTIE